MKDATSKAVRNFHVPLPEDVYLRLREEAARAGVPATDVAREAIVVSLRARRREAVRAAIERYATEAAGTAEDLDEALEAAAIDRLLREDQSKQRSAKGRSGRGQRAVRAKTRGRG